jgi:uncharacterized membrane protein
MDKWLYKISVALVVLGILVSIYMTIYKITGDTRMCGGSGGCNVVNQSRYSEIYGIPVALVGVGGYLAILAVLLLEKRNPFLRDNATMILFGVTFMGFLFTLYLVYVEIALLKALCPFCVTSQITMTLIFILSVVRLVRQPQLQEE